MRLALVLRDKLAMKMRKGLQDKVILFTLAFVIREN